MARLALPVATLALTMPVLAQSGQGSAVIAVSLEVVPNCTVAAAPLSFMSPVGSGAKATTNIAIACGPDEAFTLSLDRGTHAAGQLRRAYDPVADRYLAYDIFRDPGRSQRWGDGPGETVYGVTNASLKAYGGLAAGQRIQSGAYADQVVVSINF
ncbi:MAG: spore coat protein U domain-containing protein [Sphingomonadales bacterium]|nr:spore coat protein U domain-containing protein [Sphingomonadales bacterium]